MEKNELYPIKGKNKVSQIPFENPSDDSWTLGLKEDELVFNLTT